jgi:UTP:GlnB (protein PII) uridylyltransferase
MVMAYTKPEARERIKNRIMAGSKGGNPGQWSARKAQLLTQAYEKAGGGYSGAKTEKQKSLSKWTKEKWGTKSGKPSTQGSKATGERYLPEKARKSLTAAEYAATTKAKREGTKAGKQFVKQPKAIAKKTARSR